MKVFEFGNDLGLHDSDSHGSSFNVRRYYEKKYGVECCTLNLSTSFDVSILDYFFDNFEFIYHSTASVDCDFFKKIKNTKNVSSNFGTRRKPNFYFTHQDFIFILNISDLGEKDDGDDESRYEMDYADNIRFANSKGKKEGEELSKTINSKNSKVNILIHYPSNKAFSSFFKELSFLEKYKIEKTQRNHVYVLMKNQYGEYDFEPLDIKIPKIDLELNYGEKFKPIYDKIILKLKNTHKGLYMFHGPPGTGKSSMIKHLTNVVDKEFIFVPATFLDKFISDPDLFSILVRRKRSVLILEDAEKILISRENADNQLIATLLNMSDGILSDILETSIILTFNCEDTKIDKALKRKGRTVIDYKFDNLSKDDAKKLAKHLNFKPEQIEKIDKDMSLSEIYNINDENRFYTDEENEKKKVIGFGVP